MNRPNILPTYNFGQEGGLSYIAMRYVGEGMLKDRLGQSLDLLTTRGQRGLCWTVSRLSTP